MSDEELPDGIGRIQNGLRLTVRIRRVSDGVERDHAADWNYGWTDEKTLDGMRYQWTEGNFGCDCNRRLCHGRAGGEPDPADDVCGSTAYEVVAPMWIR